MNYTVKAAARATGVSESRLRTWERRYGVPSPGRSASHRRLYDENDLDVVRRMAALVYAGLSPVDAAEAVRAGEGAPPPLPEPAPEHPLIAEFVRAAESFDEVLLVRVLSEGTEQLGWADALDQVILPALRQIGAGWETAAIPPAKEHFASELARRTMSAALHALGPSSGDRPRIILACPESERHDLGLMGLALLLRAEGVSVVYLGADVPTPDIVEAYSILKPDAVCLSATSANGLASLVRASRTILARHGIRLFIGGPAVSPSGAVAVGTRLPSSVSAAAKMIVERLGDQTAGQARA